MVFFKIFSKSFLLALVRSKLAQAKIILIANNIAKVFLQETKSMRYLYMVYFEQK